MPPEVVRNHFLKEMGLLIWLGEWVGLGGGGGQGAEFTCIVTGCEGQKGGKHLSTDLD